MMQSQPAAMFLIGLFLLVGSDAWAGGKTVEGAGSATIENGDLEGAKKKAVASALKDSIEKVVGLELKSSFSSQMQETVRDGENSFGAKVQEEISQKASGFIDSYQIISETSDKNVVTIKVRAVVFESKLRAELSEMAELMQAAGNPTIILAIKDVFIDENGQETVAESSALGKHLLEKLLSKGLRARGAKSVLRVVEGAPKGVNLLTAPDTAAIREEAKKDGADILISGVMRVKDLGVISKHVFKSLIGKRKIAVSVDIRGLVVTTGHLIAAKPIENKKEFGASVESALKRVLHCRKGGCVNAVFETLLEGLKQKLRQRGQEGRAYQLVLRGITNYRKQGRFFSSLVADLPTVTLGKTNYNDGKMQLELTCRCSAKELEDRIFDAADQKKALQSLDLQRIQGDTLYFKL